MKMVSFPVVESTHPSNWRATVSQIDDPELLSFWWGSDDQPDDKVLVIGEVVVDLQHVRAFGPSFSEGTTEIQYGNGNTSILLVPYPKFRSFYETNVGQVIDFKIGSESEKE